MSTANRQQVLQGAVEDVLEPLARLCVAHGLPFAQAEELFKQAYVRAARQARQGKAGADAGAMRDVSAVSVATGIGRREVARIGAALQPRAVQRPSAATQLLLRWASEPKLRGRDGRPRPLPRQAPANGKGPSFESLAQSITRHVHPRSLLDELCRLGLCEVSDDGTICTLLADRFVPRQGDERLFGFLGANVGDHLAAATDNVVHGDRRHFEQAVFTDELSDEAAAQLRTLAQARWAEVSPGLVQALEALIEEDRAQGRPAAQRGRIGLFSYHQALPEERHDNAHEEDPSPSDSPSR